MLKVPSKALLLVAAIAWLIAGYFVVDTGLHAAEESWTSGMFLGFTIVFVLFFALFANICRKHTKRINNYDDGLISIVKFLDPPSYIILAVMIVIGLSVRVSGLVPESIIAFFYTGLGAALVMAALVYIIVYLAKCEELTSKYVNPLDFYKKFD